MQQEGSTSASNDFDPCPICLGPVTQAQEAYLDRCFHKFCYTCIVRWAKYVAGHHSQVQFTLKCPLCKRDNVSIVHECDGDSFLQRYINKDAEDRIFFSKAHRFRLRCYYREPVAIYDKFNVQRFWKLRKFLQANKWVHIWLKREIQALTQEEDVDIVVHHILGLIEAFARQNEQGFAQRTIKQITEEFKALISDAARPFLIGRSERFVNELELFLTSGLNVEAYDKVYSQCMKMDTSGTVREDEVDRLHKENTQVPYLHFCEDSDTE